MGEKKKKNNESKSENEITKETDATVKKNITLSEKMSDSERKNSETEIESVKSDDAKGSDSASATSLEPSAFEIEVKDTVQNLVYMSETDSDVEYFDAGKADKVSAEVLASKIKGTAGKKITETNFYEFFSGLTEIQDWYGDEEKATAEKYERLRKILEENLRELKVFKVGEIQTDIYIVGLDKENNFTGVETKAVET